ncbi:MarR family transcriptional regulator [[Eubacterium] cellulosolvens]
MPRKSDTEHEMLNLIVGMGDEGILQSELWKKMNADSREGSRTILRLEKKGLIERKKELHEGRWTYRVFAKRKLSTIDSILEIPCAACNQESRCSDAGTVTPNNCNELTKWLIDLGKNKSKEESI